jgi:hypothetical protein
MLLNSVVVAPFLETAASSFLSVVKVLSTCEESIYFIKDIIRMENKFSVYNIYIILPFRSIIPWHLKQKPLNINIFP